MADTSYSFLLSNAWYFISLTYLFALLPWTVLTNLDFISSDWRTLKATRTSGWYHFCFVLVPIPLIIFYVLVFWSAMDYTESCAAFLGLYVSFVHFLRTSWGLWQIYLFRSWAVQAIESMEEMGYEFKIRVQAKQILENVEKNEIEKEPENVDMKKEREEDNGTQNKEFHNEKLTAEEKADLILVNNTIIDNQMFHGETQCYLQYRGKMYCVEKDPYGEKAFIKRWIDGLWITLQLPFLPLMWTFDLVRFGVERGWKTRMRSGTKQSERFEISRHRVLHLPFKPVDVWLNWSTVFAAQGLNEWIQEFKVATDPDMQEEKIKDEDKLYEARRDYFAGELLAGMSLLSDVESDNERKNLSMLWEEWDEKSGIRDGTVKKRELLKAACESGRGLPFGARHIIGEADVKRETVEGLEGGQKFVGYREYRTKLEWVIGSLPVKFGGVIREFDIERLEWLTILLYLGELKKEVKKKQRKIPPATTVIKDMDTTDLSEDEDFTDGSDVCPDERYMPFRNLMSQLGFSTDPHPNLSSDGIQKPTENDSKFRKVCSFAFKKSFVSNICMTVSRTNRHALKIGEMSDIWIQLEAGKHYKFLQTKNDWWRTACLGTTIQEEMSNNNGMNNEEEGKDSGNIVGSSAQHNQRTSVTSSLRTRQKEAEISRLKYQLGDEDQKYWHLEHSLSLMGYGMEFVRSEIGHWMSERDAEKEDVTQAWKSRIRSRNSGNNSSGVGSRLGFLSSSLSDSIPIYGDRRWIEHRSVQVRLLWEIQQLVQERVKREARRGEGGPGSRVLMMHCILGFTALIVEMDDDDQRNDDARNTQDMKEEVNVSNDKNGNCIIRFCKSKENEERTKRTSHETIQIKRSTTEERKRIRKWKFRVRPQCAPQELDVWIHLEKYENDRVGVTAGVIPNANEDEKFEWEWWRDSFLCRLQALTEWQQKHQFPFVGCEDTIEHIDKGIEEKEISEIGTGRMVRMWKGWKPFRISICRFELETPGYILEDRRIEPMRTQWKSPGSMYVTTEFVLHRLQQVAITYDRAGWRELQNCFLTIKDVLKGSWDDQSSTDDRHEHSKSDNFQTVSDSEQVRTLLRKGQEGAERAILLLREIALKEKDRKSLEQCLALMSEGRYMQKDLEGAIYLLHMFLTYGPGRRSHQEIVDRGKILADTVIKFTKPLWLNQDGRYGLVEVLRLVCVRIIGMKEIDDVVEDRFEWLASFLRVRVMRYRERSTLPLLADAEADVWKTKLSQSKTGRRIESEGQEGFKRRQVSEAIKGVNEYWASCVLFERAIKVSGNKEEQWRLVNDFGLQLQDGINGIHRNALQALQLFEQAIDSGDGMVMNNLANMLQYGAEGVDKDPQRAIRLYQRAIDTGNARAMNNLANMLQHGAEGVEKDPQGALHLYEQAADAGDTLALNNQAVMLETGADGVDKDLQRAIHLYQQAIDAGNARAMNNLAHMFHYGADGVDKDPKRAFHLYQQAVGAGDVIGMTNLAVMLENGADGVDKDPKRAVHLYQKASDAGNDIAMINLAYMLEDGVEGIRKNPQRALRLYQQAVDAGNALAMNNLAYVLQHGAEGVDKDPQRALHLYQQAIDAGNASAMNNLAVLLKYGAKGVEKDPQRALHLYQQAIDAGQAQAMYNLAHMLEDGDEGINKDPQKAIHLYQRAVEAGNIQAANNLAMILEDGAEGVHKDPQRAIQLYEHAIGSGNSEAMYNLACLLEDGAEGVEKDPQRAVHLYQRASDSGDANAMNNLALMLELGAKGIEKDPQRAIRLYQSAIEQGKCTNAMNNLGHLFHYGVDGVQVDLQRAKQLYQQAIELESDSRSMYHLGCLLQHADNVIIQKDARKAKELYQQSITEADDVDAMFALAKLLEEGDEGVVKEPKRAAELYQTLVVDHEHEEALKRISKLFEEGSQEPNGMQADGPQAVKLYEKAMEGKLRRVAGQMLGRLLDLGGAGVPVDKERAAELLADVEHHDEEGCDISD